MAESQEMPHELQAALVSIPSVTDASMHSPQERAAWLIGLRRVIDRCESEFLTVLGQFDAYGDGEVLLGSANTTAWCKNVLKLSSSDAHGRVLLARQAHQELSFTISLLREGQVTYEQARMIGQSLRPLPEEAKPLAAKILNELAAHADAGTVRVVGRKIRSTVDPDGSLASAEKNFSRRALYLSPMLDGMTTVNGILDAEATATLTTALQPFLVPTSPDDDRTSAQRRADGLVDLARMSLDHSLLPDVGGNKPRLEVAVPLATLTQRGTPPAEWLNMLGEPQPLTRPQLEQFSCDATVARVVLGPTSIPLEYGRDQRLFTATQRKALATRDRGCRFPGCGRPPAHTDAHHLRSWLDNGATDLENGLLLCRFHHRAVHRGHWTIVADDLELGANGGVTFTGPLLRQLTSHPPTGPPVRA